MCAISGQSYLISSVLNLRGSTLGLANIVTVPYSVYREQFISSKDSDLQVPPCVGQRHFYPVHSGLHAFNIKLTLLSPAQP